MAIMRPCQSPMDLLASWGQRDQRSTVDVMVLANRTQPTVYRWMMRLFVRGYFRREIITYRPRGGTLTIWTITTKGREAADELRRI